MSRPTDEQIAAWRTDIEFETINPTMLLDLLVEQRDRADSLKYGPACYRTKCLQMAGLATSLWKSRRIWQNRALDAKAHLKTTMRDWLTVEERFAELEEWQQKVAEAIGCGEHVPPYGWNIADAESATEYATEIARQAHEHIECPVWCDVCTRWEAPGTCEHCNGSGAGPGCASGAYEECGWCAGDGRTHDEGHAVIDAEHLAHQREWSGKTFGPGERTAGVLDHIAKEMEEIRSKPDDVTEWADLLILAFDGAWRAGHDPQSVIDAIKEKQARNESREWPDWRTADPDKAIEHVREVSSS